MNTLSVSLASAFLSLFLLITAGNADPESAVDSEGKPASDLAETIASEQETTKRAESSEAARPEEVVDLSPDVFLEADTATGEDLASADEIHLLRAGLVAPFSAFVGDSGNWRLPVDSVPLKSWGESIAVESVNHLAENDAYRISWMGGAAQYYIQSEATLDLGSMLENDGALVMLLRLDRAPEGSFKIRMDCGYPCGAAADLARPFRSIPVDTWFRLAIDLNCFASQGADFSRIDTPFLLLADDKFVLSVSSVALVRGAAENATVKC